MIGGSPQASARSVGQEVLRDQRFPGAVGTDDSTESQRRKRNRPTLRCTPGGNLSDGAEPRKVGAESPSDPFRTRWHPCESR